MLLGFLSAWAVTSLALAGKVRGEVMEEAERGQLRSFNWKTTEFMFVFGDSFTDNTGHTDVVHVAPPHRVGGYANGYTWPDYLASTYNETKMLMRDLAWGGATIDNDLVGSVYGEGTDVVGQIARWENRLENRDDMPWHGNNTLFAMMIGHNDMRMYKLPNHASKLHAAGMDLWYKLQEKLYNDGARHFLHASILPIHRAPRFWYGQLDVLEAAIIDYNTQLFEKAVLFQKNYPDSVVQFFDTYAVFNKFLDNAEELGFKNYTSWCPAYAGGTPTPTTLYPECVNPVNEYFWVDGVHASSPVHDMLAAAMAEFLSNPVPIKVYEEVAEEVAEEEAMAEELAGVSSGTVEEDKPTTVVSSDDIDYQALEDEEAAEKLATENLAPPTVIEGDFVDSGPQEFDERTKLRMRREVRRRAYPGWGFAGI
ncbi:hypothetical protein MNV49_005348 [Pseudohyphozyma bogoriensis]|nr:hypothetical protein MNV49_005348 [Pseudohyphozyma bogoriensis]